MNKSFGKMLLELRKKHNLTQEELSDKLSYTKAYISLLENNKRNPSIEFLNNLSKLYNMDLNIYYRHLYSDISFEHREIYTRFRTVIESNNANVYQLLFDLLEEYKDSNCFQSGEMKNLYNYAKALCYFYNNKLEDSISMCTEALKTNNHSVKDLETSSSFFTPIEYCLMVVMAVMQINLNNDSIGKKNLLLIYKNIKETYFSDNFFMSFNLTIIIRVYIILNNNISTLYLEDGNYIESLFHINEAINFNHKYYNSSLLHNLYFTKTECLYAMNDYENAKKSILQILVNCSSKSNELLDTYIDKIKTSFPNILYEMNLDSIRKLYL